MRSGPLWRAVLIIAAMFAAASCAEPPHEAAENGNAKPPQRFEIPLIQHTLDNGLRVVLAPDSAVPTVTVAVYYHIGFRNEPRGRTGFAHLFEHLMFQGSANLGKMEFVRLVQGAGGVLNGSTRFDFTNYYQVVPAHKLETILWAEADRMRSLDISEENLRTEQEVVVNEVLGNVDNRPYGGFPWLQLPQAAFENWYNAHNFYGELEDIRAATLEEARDFFEAYYPPNNAVLVVAGDFDADEAIAMIERHFGDIAPRDVPQMPDFSEPRQEEEKTVTLTDALAPRPALAFGYQLPPRGTPEYFAMGLIDKILLDGNHSRLHRALVREHGFSSGIGGGINVLGNMFNTEGPNLFYVSLVHDDTHAPGEILAVVDAVIDDLRENPVTQEELDLALTMFRSSFYDMAGSANRFGLVDLLAVFKLFDGNAGEINRIEENFRRVTPELIQQTAREYLRPTNRTVLILNPVERPQEGNDL
jgi:zinc protease